MSEIKSHPSSVAINVPSEDGSLLRFTLNQDPEARAFTEESLLEVEEQTGYGLRPLVTYRVQSFLQASRGRDFKLHDGESGLRIHGGWMVHLFDWIEMMTDDSSEIWGAGS